MTPDTMLPIAKAVGRQRRKTALVGWAVVAPALLYLLVTFVGPIIGILATAVTNGEVSRRLSQTASALSEWSGEGIPSDATAKALILDLSTLQRSEVAAMSRDLNNRISGYRSLLIKTHASMAGHPDISGMASLQDIDARWGDTHYWSVMREATIPYTAYYVLAALDLRQDDDGNIVQVEPSRQIYLNYIWRTFAICFVVTLICTVVGFPLAWYISQSSPRLEKILIFLILVPFWTSILVRTAAWVIVLQRNGLLNEALISIGLTSEPMTLIYNRFAVCVAMVHVLLPFMVLPIYSVMKSIPPQYMRAALSLGASPLAAFREVYLPMALPGVSAGVTMVFVLGLGYYITPALVGGPTDQMESGLIAEFALGSANWSMASAIALVLLVMTGVLFIILKRALRLTNISGI